MFNAILSFLVLLNPIEIFIMLHPVLIRMTRRQVSSVMARASVVALILYLLFAFTGDFLFTRLLQIDFDSFRVFGGFIITYLSFQMIVHGKKSFITYSDDHSAVANQIAMPVMVGAGTVAVAILMGSTYGRMVSAVAITSVLIINFLVIVALVKIRSTMADRYVLAFDKNMETLLRLLAFLGGAIGLDMVATGIKGLL
jgi:multiple antibiotic resistance protein